MNRKIKKILIDEYNEEVSNTPNFTKLASRLDLQMAKEPLARNREKGFFRKTLVLKYIVAISFVAFLVIGGSLFFLDRMQPKNTTPNNSIQVPSNPPTATEFRTKNTLAHIEEMGAELTYTRESVIIINNTTDKEPAISVYAEMYQLEIMTLINQFIAGNENYFSTYSLIVSPFVFSSSEAPIEVSDVLIKPDTNTYTIVFRLFSPEEYDMDVHIQFFVIELAKTQLLELDFESSVTGNFTIFNTRNGTNTSAYYH